MCDPIASLRFLMIGAGDGAVRLFGAHPVKRIGAYPRITHRTAFLAPSLLTLYVLPNSAAHALALPTTARLSTLMRVPHKRGVLVHAINVHSPRDKPPTIASPTSHSR